MEVAKKLGILCFLNYYLYGSVDLRSRSVLFSIIDEKPSQKLSPNFFLSGSLLREF